MFLPPGIFRLSDAIQSNDLTLKVCLILSNYPLMVVTCKRVFVFVALFFALGSNAQHKRRVLRSDRLQVGPVNSDVDS